MVGWQGKEEEVATGSGEEGQSNGDGWGGERCCLDSGVTGEERDVYRALEWLGSGWLARVFKM